MYVSFLAFRCENPLIYFRDFLGTNNELVYGLRRAKYCACKPVIRPSALKLGRQGLKWFDNAINRGPSIRFVASSISCRARFHRHIIHSAVNGYLYSLGFFRIYCGMGDRRTQLASGWSA